MFNLSIRGYCKTLPHRSYCFLSMFKLHYKRHYRNLAVVQHDVNTSRKRRRRDADMRSAAAAAHSSIRDTAFGLHLSNLLSMLWNIGWRNWATFCTLLAASRKKHLATCTHHRAGRPCLSNCTMPFVAHARDMRGPADHAFCGPRKIQRL